MGKIIDCKSFWHPHWPCSGGLFHLWSVSVWHSCLCISCYL